MKKLKIICLITALSFAATACASKDETSGTEIPQETAAVSVSTSTDTKTNTETVSDGRKIISGEVTEVIGNMLTIKLMKEIDPENITEEDRKLMQEQAAAMLRESGDAQNAVAGNMPEGFSGMPNIAGMSEEELKALGEQFLQNGAEIMGADGEAFRIDGGRFSEFADMTDEEREAAMKEAFPDGLPEGFQEGIQERMNAKTRVYTGETIDIIVPVGAPVTDEAGLEIKVENIKSGDIITAKYASDNLTVASVALEEARKTIGGGGTDGNWRISIPGGGEFGMVTGGGDFGTITIE
ncbi:hypothetical protein FACS189490_04870 [Clostridia bacterium]|nr:hypothetical protein FACS189490_04870 [Clostridia bacterium]